MATMLDYERLVQRVAYLSVENAKLKGHHRNGEDQRWNIIEEQAPVGTLEEERRLRRIIRDWEERYDILCELFMKSRFDTKPPNWHEVVSDREYRFQREKERKATWDYRIRHIREAKMKLKSLWALIRGQK